METYEAFCRRFASEDACVEALAKAKWPRGFRCPRCDHHEAYLIRSQRLPLYQCRRCAHQTSLTVGTVLEGSRVPLRDWFRAIFLHTQSGGISAARLSQVLSVTYKTAWLMGHKIRHAMSTMDSARKLKGLIRITPAKYGQAYNPTCFRHPQEHPVLIGAALLSNGQAKYVKIKQVMSENITNRTPGYIGVLKFLEEHAIRTAGEIVSDVGRPLGERSKMLAQLGKSAFHWLNATFRGIGPKHLQLYLDQYCFHENYRIGRLSIFDLGLSLCVKFAKITLRQLVERPSLAPVTADYDRMMNMKRAARSRARKRVVS